MLFSHSLGGGGLRNLSQEKPCRPGICHSVSLAQDLWPCLLRHLGPRSARWVSRQDKGDGQKQSVSKGNTTVRLTLLGGAGDVGKGLEIVYTPPHPGMWSFPTCSDSRHPPLSLLLFFLGLSRGHCQQGRASGKEHTLPCFLLSPGQHSACVDGARLYHQSLSAPDSIKSIVQERE